MKLDAIPPEVTRQIIEDMHRYFAAGAGAFQQDAIAAETLHRLKPYERKFGSRLRLNDIKELFVQMKDEGL